MAGSALQGDMCPDRVPVDACSSGKVLAAFRPDVVHGRGRSTEALDSDDAVAASEGLQRELEHVRSSGFALGVEDAHAGINSLAVPVRVNGEDVAAALSILGPASQIAGETAPPHLARVRLAARRLGTLVTDA